MGGYGLSGLGATDPGSPYNDPTLVNSMGFGPMNPMQMAMADPALAMQSQLANSTQQQLASGDQRTLAELRAAQMQPKTPSLGDQVSKLNNLFGSKDQNSANTSPYVDPTQVNTQSPVPSTPAAATPAAPAASTPGTSATPSNTGNPVADYIIQGAKARGLDPNEALHVVSTEGGLGAFKIGDKTQMGSGGPFQLNMLPGSLGDQMYKQTGLNPLDPKNEKAGIDFALDYAKNHGGHFDPNIWHGLKNNPYTGGTVSIPKSNFGIGAGDQGNNARSNPMPDYGGGPSGTDTSVDTSNLPPLTNSRALAQSALVDPSSLQNPQTAQMLQTLVNNPNMQRVLSGQGNPSTTLARMAAGFLSGNGHQSGLAGGFAGLAAGQQADQSERDQLFSGLQGNANDLYKMGVQNNMGVNRDVMNNQFALQKAQQLLKMQMPLKLLDAASTISKNQGIGFNTAYNQVAHRFGIDTGQTDDQAQAADNASLSQKPLASGPNKSIMDLANQARSMGQLASDGMAYNGALKSGQFHLDGPSTVKYGAQLSGWDPFNDDRKAASAYNGFKSWLTQAAGDVMNTYKGPASDKRAEMAQQTLQGNGLNTDESGEIHTARMAAIGEIQRRSAIAQIKQTFINEKHVVPSDSDISKLVGGVGENSPLANASDADLQKMAHQGVDTSGNIIGASPTVGGGTGGVGQPMTTKGGMPVMYTPPPGQ